LTANLFFVPGERMKGTLLVLDGPEHRHLRAARVRAGEEIWLFDETGVRTRAVVESAAPQATRLLLKERERPGEERLRITLAQAVLKAKAMEDVIERTAEWGLFALVPILAERTVVKLDERAEKKSVRWRQIALASAEQSKSGRIPRVDAPRTLADFLGEKRGGRRVVLSERGGRPFRELIGGFERGDAAEPEDWTLLIGPEGGWSERELAEIEGAGYKAASLGPWVLRAGTAALSAVALLAHGRGL
jgi:16S rRNA (uracil1498-N3)-methyltransferase